MKYYTLYYQPQAASYRKFAIATSDSLLKLCKIECMTFRDCEGFPFIVETAKADDKDAFRYGAGCLFEYEHAEFVQFANKVNEGKYYNSYDYSQRVRELTR